jgi:pyruvate, water dikinase
MQSTGKTPGGGWLGALVRTLLGRPDHAEKVTGRGARFRLMYERFREILSFNESTLELIADIEDRLASRSAFSLDAVLERTRRAAMDVFVMVKDLNQITDGRHGELYEALRRVSETIERESEARPAGGTTGALVLPLRDVRAADVGIAGGKLASLGEVMAEVGVDVPDGFVITSTAFASFMSANDLRPLSSRLECVLEARGPAGLTEACREVSAAILGAPIPPEVMRAVTAAYDALACGADVPLAVRSSAIGEDGTFSHAGQYHTELNVSRSGLLDAYRRVVASAFGPTAVIYRFETGLGTWETAVAVGCMRMVEPRASGIMFSRPFQEPEADQVVISAVRGLAAGVAAGVEGAEELTLRPGELAGRRAVCLDEHDLSRLVVLARRLETHFGQPQDIEWAIDAHDKLFVLQTRAMTLQRPTPDAAGQARDDAEAILEGGRVACRGMGSGPVHHIATEADLDKCPDGAVIVARHSSPTFSRVMRRCAAIVTDVGSPTGHMAILAREFNVPTIVGLATATSVLVDGEVVTVDATNSRVLTGAVAPTREPALEPTVDSPAVQSLRRVASRLTPLNLTDPNSSNFSPAGCQTLHDITRYVHEKVFEVMFHYGDLAMSDQQSRMTLDARLPIAVLVFDVGGGVADGIAPSRKLRPEQIVSVPVVAFLAGLTDERIRWDQPRPVSGRGFLSVVGESMMNPPAEAQDVGRPSYVVMSDRYMNFSTKAGYHFSTVDTYCGLSTNKNYIHFRFCGGGADNARRVRRIRFLSVVLAALDFQVRPQRDELVARLQKFPRETIVARLTDLGRLTMVARQLDMLMDSDASADSYAKAFLEGRMEKF